MSDNTGYESEAKGTSRIARAAAREGGTRQAAPPTAGPLLRRRRRASDPMAFDKRIIPEGMDYQWKTETIYGEPQRAHQIDLRENHWRAVPASRHPELSQDEDTVIRRGGSILMERPKYLSDEAAMEDILAAREPIEQQEQLMFGTPAGHMTRDHPSVRRASYVNRQYSPGEPVIDDSKFAEP
jgi:hypothetical protein